MTIKFNLTMLHVLFLAGVCLLCSSCSKDAEYGVYNEEQMQHIPLVNQDAAPAASGGCMVMAVFSQTITSDEILNTMEDGLKTTAEKLDADTFCAQVRPYVKNVVKGKVTDILLYQEARKAAPDDIDQKLDKAVEGEVSRFIASYRNNYALAESKIKEMGFDWRTFREYQKKLIMTQSYLSDKLNEQKRFSQQTLRDYYQAHLSDFSWDGKVGFSVIDIQPQALPSSLLQANETADAAAMRLASEAVAQLKNGSDFAALAKRYQGPLAAIGGKVEAVTMGKNSLSEPYNTLESYATKMQAGQISQPIQMDGHVFVLKVDTLTLPGRESFDAAQNDIRQRLMFQHRQQQYTELVNKLILKADPAQVEQFTDFCVRQAYARWGKNGPSFSAQDNQKKPAS